MQANNILRIKDGATEEIWYSGDYIKRQIEDAYMAGLCSASRVQMSFLILKGDEPEMKEYERKFWEEIQKEYKKRFEGGHVWKVAENGLNKKYG